MPQNKPQPTTEEILRKAGHFFKKSVDLRNEIERLPILFRDTAIHITIHPLLRGGEGITPRRIMVLRERVLHRLVKEYFKRQGYDAYTDEEFWIRARHLEGGFAQEKNPIPDVFAGDPVPAGKLVIPKQLVVAEVKKNTSAESVRKCIGQVDEYLKFANKVYAAFSLARPFSAENIRMLLDEVPDVGVLLVREGPSSTEPVRETRPAKDHTPPDQTKWYKYRDQLRCAKAWEKQGKRPASPPKLKLSKHQKRRLDEWEHSEEHSWKQFYRILDDEPDEWPD
jgi:hypothetical protein